MSSSEYMYSNIEGEERRGREEEGRGGIGIVRDKRGGGLPVIGREEGAIDRRIDTNIDTYVDLEGVGGGIGGEGGGEGEGDKLSWQSTLISAALFICKLS